MLCQYIDVSKYSGDETFYAVAENSAGWFSAPEEVDAERTVIVSEREGLENDPSFLLGESLQGSNQSMRSTGRAERDRTILPSDLRIVSCQPGHAQDGVVRLERCRSEAGFEGNR